MGKLIDKLKEHKIEITSEIEKLVMEEFVDKSEVDLKDTEITDLKHQIKTRDTDIEELKKVDGAKLQESLQSLQTLQTKYKEDTEKLNKQLSDAIFEGNFAKAISGKKVKDADILKSLIVKDKDISEQIQKYETEKAFLFDNVESKKHLILHQQAEKMLKQMQITQIVL